MNLPNAPLLLTGLLSLTLGACTDNPAAPPTGPFDIAFTREPVDGATPPEVWVMRADGTNQKQVTENGVAWMPRLSPDGSQIVFESIGTELDIMDVKTGARRKLASGVPCCAQWSPDGTVIAFTNSTGLYTPHQIFIIDPDGTNLRQLTSDASYTDTSFSKDVASWSPDGNRILFTAEYDNVPNPTTALYVMQKDGTGMTPITDTTAGGVGNSAAWSPDGRMITFVADGGFIGMSQLRYHSTIHTMNADGTGRVQLSADTSKDSFPNWSPDGKQILFSSERDGHSQIYVMNADGTSQRRLVTSSTNDRYPSWRHP